MVVSWTWALLVWSVARAEEPAPAVDPSTAPITTATTAADAGPFECTVDPFVTVRAGETEELRIKLSMAKGTKLYVDQIYVEFTNAAGLVPGDVVLPPGETYDDPHSGETRQVYTSETRITVPVTSPADHAVGRVDMTVSVGWQGCSDRLCYMPSGQTFNVPVRVLKGR
jgi:thiol:disulfide interchange protein